MNSAQLRAQTSAINKLKVEFGPEICHLFADDRVIEIMLNPDGSLWVERLGEDMEQFGAMPPIQAECLIGTLAAMNDSVITKETPLLSCELPKEFGGARFEGAIPPVVDGPAFAIRKKAIAVFTLQDYVNSEIMTQGQREVIELAVRERKNILIAGGTGSGKTTLTNAVIKYIADACAKDRLMILEDTAELQCAAKNKVPMKTSHMSNLTELTKRTLRYRIDRILVGEVRDGAALNLLMAWKTGHPGGVCTLHSNDAYTALARLEQMIALVSVGPQQQTIAEAVDLVIYIEKCSGSRRVKELMRVDGFDGQRYLTQQVGNSNEQ